jgi:chromosome segregation ATPase
MRGSAVVTAWRALVSRLRNVIVMAEAAPSQSINSIRHKSIGLTRFISLNRENEFMPECMADSIFAQPKRWAQRF